MTIPTNFNKDETALEYASRAVSWLEMNEDMDDLPTLESVFELFYLIGKTYDVSILVEVYDQIAYESADPKPLINFIKKYKLDWVPPVILAEVCDDQRKRLT